MGMTNRPGPATGVIAWQAWRAHSGIYLLVVLSTLVGWAQGAGDCGDYYEIGGSTVGNLYSPDYPNVYTPYSKCIWLIQTDVNYKVQLSITWIGERYAGNCADYLEIRDETSTGPLLGQFCDTYSSYIVTSTHRWMWILLVTDGLTTNSTAMRATFSSVVDSNPPSDTYRPIESCRSYQFECPNRQCLSMSYRCDGYNDCGCVHQCDEDGCGPLVISKDAQIVIAACVGLFVFIVVCSIAFILEGKNSWHNSESEAREKETMAEQRRKRASRAFSKFINDESMFKASPSGVNITQNNPTLAVTDCD